MESDNESTTSPSSTTPIPTTTIGTPSSTTTEPEDENLREAVLIAAARLGISTRDLMSVVRGCEMGKRQRKKRDLMLMLEINPISVKEISRRKRHPLLFLALIPAIFGVGIAAEMNQRSVIRAAREKAIHDYNRGLLEDSCVVPSNIDIELICRQICSVTYGKEKETWFQIVESISNSTSIVNIDTNLN